MNVQAVLKSQYHASVSMLREAVECCPPELWENDSYVNPFWHVAYHVLFYTDFYLQPSESTFVPWEHHRPKHNFLGDRSVTPYSVDEIRTYCARCDAMIDSAIDRLDLSAPDSGFSWYKMSKLEHQLVSLRHLQHHIGQLTERIRQAAGRGVQWVGGASSRM